MNTSIFVVSYTVETGFCASPWIPYNGHCFHLHRELKTWAEAQKECRKEEGDLVNIRNVEDQSFVISQLGYGREHIHCEFRQKMVKLY